jgi:DNA-binding Lrp family transcriptional regulator
MGKMGNPPSHNGASSILGSLDYRDKDILQLLLVGMSNRAIANRLHIPMSTVQRRTRRLFEKGIVKSRIELDYEKLGLRRGLLHVYLRDGDIHNLAKKVSMIKGVQTTSIHVGNSDVLGFFVFKDAGQLLDIMNQAKKTEGVDRVVWSEEVFAVHATERSMDSIFAPVVENKNMANP